MGYPVLLVREKRGDGREKGREEEESKGEEVEMWGRERKEVGEGTESSNGKKVVY